MHPIIYNNEHLRLVYKTPGPVPPHLCCVTQRIQDQININYECDLRTCVLLHFFFSTWIVDGKDVTISKQVMQLHQGPQSLQVLRYVRKQDMCLH